MELGVIKINEIRTFASIYSGKTDNGMVQSDGSVTSGYIINDLKNNIIYFEREDGYIIGVSRETVERILEWKGADKTCPK